MILTGSKFLQDQPSLECQRQAVHSAGLLESSTLSFGKIVVGHVWYLIANGIICQPQKNILITEREVNHFTY
jgi:hypothetical protein